MRTNKKGQCYPLCFSSRVLEERTFMSMRFLSLLPLDDDADCTQIRSASTTGVVLAQWLALLLHSPKVPGSNPVGVGLSLFSCGACLSLSPCVEPVSLSPRVEPLCLSLPVWSLSLSLPVWSLSLSLPVWSVSVSLPMSIYFFYYYICRGHSVLSTQ